MGVLTFPNRTGIYSPFGMWTTAVGDGTTDDTAAIQRDIDTLSAAGDGTIYFGPRNYYIASAITPAPGVTLQGSGWTTDNSGAFTHGTKFLGAGTNACIAYHPTDSSPRASQPTQGQCTSDALYNFNVRDIAFHNFTYAIKGGSLYNPGFFRSEFWNILVTGHTTWGVYFENCSQCRFENIMVRNMGTGAVGNMYFGASHTNYTHGNSVANWLYGENTIALTRGIVVQTRAGASLNQFDLFHVQDTQYGTTAYATQAATLTNSSSTVTVTDGTKYAVDEPVVFATAPSGGFGSDAYQVFFVVSKSGNDLTLSSMQRGAAITFTGSTTSAHSLVSFGFPCIEISGLETNYDDNGTVDSGIQSVTMKGIDAEGAAGSQVFIQNARVDLGIVTITDPFTGKGTNYGQNFCSRQSFGQWNSTYAINVDIDSGTSPLFAVGSYVASYVNKSPLGIWYDYTLTQFVVNVSDSNSNAARSLMEQEQGTSGKTFLYPGNSIGQRQWYSSTTTLTLDAGYAGTILFTGSSAGTWTLPTLVSGRGGTVNGATAGLVYEIVNDSATTGFDLAVVAGGSDKIGFRGAATTTYTLNQGESVTLRACWVSPSSVFWAVISNNGGVAS